MDHLYNSAVSVSRLKMQTANGRASMQWVPEKGLAYVPCRLDLSFLRPGKDQPMPVQAGVAPDRIGVMFCSPDYPIKAGDRLTAVPNAYGDVPVPGTFEIRVMPDIAQDYSGGHHIEVQIIEVAQALVEEREFPGGVDGQA